MLCHSFPVFVTYSWQFSQAWLVNSVLDYFLEFKSLQLWNNMGYIVLQVPKSLEKNITWLTSHAWTRKTWQLSHLLLLFVFLLLCVDEDILMENECQWAPAAQIKNCLSGYQLCTDRDKVQPLLTVITWNAMLRCSSSYFFLPSRFLPILSL